MSPPETRTPTERLYRVVRDGMCIGCGLCESVAGADRVRVQRVANGYERPVVVGQLDHETVDRILDVCPGTRLDGLPVEQQDERTQHDLVWGPYQRIVLAYASDPAVRHQGATGGALTALGQYLVDAGKVAFVLHARAHGTIPTFGERHLSWTAADVLEGAGSRYGPTAPLVDIEAQLARGEPFAFIGKPCDAAALRNLARTDERVNELVRYWLAPVCGGFMPPEGMDRFLREREGIDPADVTRFRYRGFGCPGPTRFETRDGTVRERRYTDFWGTDESQWVLPFRCKVCPDGIGETVDIAASDTWPGGSPDPATEDADAGTNALVIRTRSGLDLVEAAEQAGYLTVEADRDPRYMDSVQPHQRNKKEVVFARWAGLADEGCTVPISHGLRLEALDATLDGSVRTAQREGTRQRVQAGRNREPDPAGHPLDG